MKQKLKNYLFSAGVIVFVTGVYAQSGNSFDYNSHFKLPQLAAPSPDVAAIEKFGNIPVNYSTGVPNISIPIWTISCGNIKWPISLSYHAGGIRVDEVASSAGLGWSVLGAGVISRAVVGRPDEYEIGEPDFATVSPYNNWQYLWSVADGLKDNELDIFSYNFNGRSGKFIIKQNGSIFQIPYSNLKIVNNNHNSFLVTDEEGVTYLFDKKETTQTEQSNLQNLTYTSAWYLSKVELPDKLQKIEFTYIPAGYSIQNFRNYTHAVGERYVVTGSGGVYGETVSIIPINDNAFSNTYQQVNELILSGISFSNGNISFNYSNNRVDKIGSSLNKVQSISVYNNEGGVSNQVKNLVFNHSYFFYRPPGVTADAPQQYRLKLDGLQEYGSVNSQVPKTYSFVYNATPIVPRENFGQDKWGFNNGKYNNASLVQSEAIFFNGTNYSIGNADRTVDINAMQACMLNEIKYPTGGKTNFVYEPNVYFSNERTFTKSSEQAFAMGDVQQVGSKIFTYPLNNAEEPRIKAYLSSGNLPGVYDYSYITLKNLTTNTQIFFQANTTPAVPVNIDSWIALTPGHMYEIKAYIFTNTPNPQLEARVTVEWKNYNTQAVAFTGGGLRIKEIKNYTSDLSLATRESYNYEPATLLLPGSSLQQSYKEVKHRLGISNCVYFEAPKFTRVYQSGSIYPLSTALGSPMLYTKVTKTSIDAVSSDNGRSEYEYDVFPDSYFPVPEPSLFNMYFLSNDWKNGFLKREQQYKKHNGNYSLLRKVENIYAESKISETTGGVKISRKYAHSGCELQNQIDAVGDLNYFTYPIRTSSKKLLRTYETLYDATGAIETVTENEYGNSAHDFVTKTIVTNSSGSKKSIQFKYPADFSAPGNISEKMVNQNIIAPVIEQKVFTGNTLLSTVNTIYKDWYNDSKVLKPEIIRGSLYNNNPENRIRFYNYDNYGNQLELSKENDAKESYIWGYGNQYPVAKIVNADYNTAVQYVSLSVLNSPATTESQMRTELDKIRTGLAGTKALVTTYTYKPLIGISSETDARGRTTYYEYDPFNRLKLIRDQDGKIVKTFDYKYQQPQ